MNILGQNTLNKSLISIFSHDHLLPTNDAQLKDEDVYSGNIVLFIIKIRKIKII